MRFVFAVTATVKSTYIAHNANLPKKKNRKNKKFKCLSCGHADHADANASFNIAFAPRLVIAPKAKKGRFRKGVSSPEAATTDESSRPETIQLQDACQATQSLVAWWLTIVSILCFFIPIKLSFFRCVVVHTSCGSINVT